MTTGTFLVCVFAWLAWVGVWELIAKITKEKEIPYITTLARKHFILRASITGAIGLTLIWWVMHSAQQP